MVAFIASLLKKEKAINLVEKVPPSKRVRRGMAFHATEPHSPMGPVTHISSTMPYRTSSIYKCEHNNARLKSIAAESFQRYAATTMGRPRQKPEHYRGRYVRIRVTDSERAEILRRSKKAKAKNESVWIRQRLLGDD